MRLTVRLSMTLVAVAAFALSFQSLMELGALAGYGRLAWLYPCVVDLGTVSSCTAWLHARSRQAFWMTWTLLSISVVQNGTVHWLIATGKQPAWWLITLVATVPPATLGMTVHLGVGMGRPDRRKGEERPAGPTSPLHGAQGGNSSDTRVDCSQNDVDRPGQLGSGNTELTESVAPRLARPELPDVSQVTDVANGANGEHGIAELVAGRRPGQPETGGIGLTGPVDPLFAEQGKADVSQVTYVANGANGEHEVADLVARDIDTGRPDQRLGPDEELAGPPVSGGAYSRDGDANTTHDKLADLISQGVGRRRLAAQLDISEHQARQLIAERRNGGGQR